MCAARFFAVRCPDCGHEFIHDPLTDDRAASALVARAEKLDDDYLAALMELARQDTAPAAGMGRVYLSADDWF